MIAHSLQVFQGKMNFLNVANGLQLPFVRVRNKALIGLNGQTVATAVRDTLRRAYKKSEIKVSQTASLGSGRMARPALDSGC